MKTINSLSDEQVAQFPRFVDKWVKIGMQTGPCDRVECIKIVNEIAEMHGFSKPKEYFFCSSPQEAMQLIVKNHDVSNKEAIDSMMYGYNDSWLSFYDYFLEMTDIQIAEQIKPLIKLSKVCGWWSYIDDKVYFQDRPEIINIRNGLLHCEDGPSIRFSDGFSVWSLNGYRVTEQIVLKPDTLTINQINNESNADIQSIMIERFGWERYLEETNAKQIDSRRNNIENTLEILYNTAKFGKRLVCTCPTGRVFVKGVHGSVSTCEEAQNWLSGYQLENRKKFRTIGRT